MKILLDECVDWRLKFDFIGHEVKSVQEMDWLGKKNGELMKAASDEGFEAFVTIDKNLKFQQNIKQYPLAILILDHPRSTRRHLKPLVVKVLDLLKKVKQGQAYIITL